MKYRAHRGLLAESMTTVVELPPTLAALATQLQVSPARLAVKPYTFDARINWDTHIVTLDGNAIGFTDGPLQDNSK